MWQVVDTCHVGEKHTEASFLFGNRRLEGNLMQLFCHPS